MTSLTYTNTKQNLQYIANQAAKDLMYTNGKWSTQLFNSDPLMPYPNSSGPFPLYVITNDGFILARSNPINGLLDTTDQKTLAAYNQPTTFRTPVNEVWRVLSRKTKYSDNVAATVIVAYYNPQDANISTIDSKLMANMDTLTKGLSFDGKSISAQQIDVRTIDYDVSFEIIDQTNHVLLSNGRIPTFLDTSYLYNEYQQTESQLVTDTRTNENFLIMRKPLMKDNTRLGLVVVGKSLQSNLSLINTYLTTMKHLFPLLILPLTILAVVTTYLFAKLLHLQMANPIKQVKSIVFDRKTGKLSIDNKDYTIPLDSIQYSLCSALFTSDSSNGVSQETLLIQLESKDKNKDSKRLYDAMIGINKKVGFKLIVYENKNYFFNPSLIEKINFPNH